MFVPVNPYPNDRTKAMIYYGTMRNGEPERVRWMRTLKAIRELSEAGK